MTRKESRKLKIEAEQEPEVINRLLSFSNWLKDKLDNLGLQREERLAEKKHSYE
jgi:hypothetical protein